MIGRRPSISARILIGCSLALAWGAASEGQSPLPGTEVNRPCTPGKRIDRTQFEVSEATGGQALILDPSEISRSVDALAADFRGIDETIFRINGTLSGSTQDLVVPVDSTVSVLNFSIFVECLDDVAVLRPSGAEVLATDEPAVVDQRFRSGRVLTVSSPEVGEWRARFSGRGLYSALARAKSEIGLTDARFVKEDGQAQRDREEERIVSPPAGLQQRLIVRVVGIESPRITIVSAEGAEIQEVAVDEPTAGELQGTLIVPTRPFRVAVEGRDKNGFACRRIQPALVHPANQ